MLISTPDEEANALDSVVQFIPSSHLSLSPLSLNLTKVIVHQQTVTHQRVPSVTLTRRVIQDAFHI